MKPTCCPTSAAFIALLATLFLNFASTAPGLTINYEISGAVGDHYSGIAVAPDHGTVWNAGLIDGASAVSLILNVTDSKGVSLPGHVIVVQKAGGTNLTSNTQTSLGMPNPLLLMQDYLDGGNFEITLGGLAQGSYLLYVFAHGDEANQNSTVTLHVANGGAVGTTGDAGTDYRNLDATGAEGYAYLKFQHVPVAADGLLIFNAMGYLNGFQLVKEELPVIRTQPPVELTAYVGLSISISATIEGPDTMTFQWQKSADAGVTFHDLDSGANPSAATAALTLSNVAGSDAGLYRLIANTVFGNVTSDTTLLHAQVNPAPLFSVHPSSQTVTFDQAVTLETSAYAPTGVSYQWYLNGAEISGANAATYAIASISLSDLGTYTVVASNAFGSTTSHPATLTMTLPAFPGADGPGANASGGRGGEVYHVTNLDDDITNPPVGSLRYGLKNVPPGGRTIVFDVSGLIFLDPAGGTAGWLKSGESNLTVAGQTAPAPGITIAGQGTKFSGNNVIIRHLKIRPGKHQVDPGLSTHDGISNYLQNSIIDHVSISWADDESLSSTDFVDTATVQYCIVGEALYYALEGGKTHAYGALINSEVSDVPLSYHHNLFAHIQSRLPRIQNEVDSGSTGAILNWSNNVIYNWSGNAAYTGTGESTRTNFIGNYYIAGYNTSSSNRTFYSPDGATRLYIEDNYRDMDKDGLLDGSAPSASVFVGGTFTRESTAFSEVDIPELDAPGTSVATVTARAGAFWWDRDAVDARLVSDTLNQTGHFVTDPSDVGGWDPTGTVRPAGFDRDRDGMSDAWEAAHGLNPLVADDSGDINGDGYTNLQNYLNDLGAFPLLGEARWYGGPGRYADPSGWHEAWQPSRFDTVTIGKGSSITVATPGNWAGRVLLDPSAGENATITIEDGWWHIAGDLETSSGGQSTIVQSGGMVRIDGTLHLDSLSGSTAYTLSGGTLSVRSINVAAGGTLNLTGGTLHAAAIAAPSLALAGARLAPGSDAAVEALAASLSDRALVAPVNTTVGTTTVTGNLDLTGGTLVIDLQAADQFDTVNVSGELILGGSLKVLTVGGYTPTLGTPYRIAQAGSLAGSFSSISNDYIVSQSDDNGVILTYVGKILTYDDWAAEYPFVGANDDLAGSDPDLDGWRNLDEFAFDGFPLGADRPRGLPILSAAPSGVIPVDEGSTLLRFSHRPSSDLTYTVQISDDLEQWADFWTTRDGWEAAAVESHLPGVFFDELALRIPLSKVNPTFARVRADLSEDLVLMAPLGLTGAAGVPTDIPPSLVFNRPVTAGTAGTIRLHEANGTLVSTIDLASNPQRSVGNEKLHYYPVTTNGNIAMITFDRNLMTYGKTYYVTMDAGVIRDATGNPWEGVSDDQTLRFTTRGSGPASSAPLLTVDTDGTADFCTVQGALEHIGNLLPDRVTIEVADGSYEELIYVSNQRGPVTIRGESRDGTVIHYANNARFNSSRASFRNRAHDLTVENLTLINTTPEGGSQAEAFMSQASRVVVRNCTLSSYQDTVRIDKSAYFDHCYIEGDVDYIWGDGLAYFDRCTIHTLDSGYIVQARNEGSAHGFIFKECLLTADPGVSGVFLARIDPNAYPESEVVFINCAMGDHIAPVGWLLNNASSAPHVRFFEYMTTDLDGVPLNTASRLPDSTQLEAGAAAPYVHPTAVLGFDPANR